MTTPRRFFLFTGEHTAGGVVPTGVGATSYVFGSPLTGDWMVSGGNFEAHWPTIGVRGAAASGIGPLAYVWNHIGRLGTPAVPAPSLDWLEALWIGVSQNARTDPIEGGAYPSAYRGVEASFLAQAHGGRLHAENSVATANPLMLDPTFTLKKGSYRARLLPKEEFLGRVGSVASLGGTTVEITLAGGASHGRSPSATFTVWIAGLSPLVGVEADPQLTGKFTATADATNPSKFSVVLPAEWNGNAGSPGSGFVAAPYYGISAVTNPSGNVVRLQLTNALTDANSAAIYNQTAEGALWIGDVGGISTPIDGRWTVVQNGLRFAPIDSAATVVSFTSGTKTISRSSGSWTRTPAAGEKIRITGSTSNNATLTVVSATSSTIVVSETIVTAAAGPAITIHSLNYPEFTFPAAPSVAGYTGDGWCFARPYYHPVFSGDCGSRLLFDELVTLTSAVDINGRTQLNSFGASSAYANNTIGDEDSAIICQLGYNDYDATGDRSTCLALSWGQLYYEFLRDLRVAVAGALSTPDLDPETIALLIVPLALDVEAFGYGSAGYADQLTTAQAAIIAQTRVATARLSKAALVEWADLPLGDGGGTTPSSETFVEIGYRLWTALEQLNAVGTAGTASLGLPIYWLLGQSQTTSVVPAAAFLPQPAYSTGDPDYDGSWYDPTYTTVIRERLCFIWNAFTGQPEEYAPVKNAVTFLNRTLTNHPSLASFISVGPPIGGAIGPEVSLVLELRKRHPEGFLLVKLGVPSAALQPVSVGSAVLPTFDPNSNDLAPDIVSLRDAVFAWCYANGRVPDSKAVFFDQGESDAFDPWHLTYQQALTDWITWLRDRLTTTASRRSPLPFVIGRLQSHARVNAAALSRYEAVQAAQDAVAASVANVAIANMQDLPIGSDNVHRTPHALLIAGQRMNDALDSTTLLSDGYEEGEGASINPEISHGSSSGSGQALAGTAPEGSTAGATAMATVPASTLLEAVETALLTFATNGFIQTYSINGRTVTRASIPELQALRDRLRAETIAAQGGARNYARRGRI
jgi:hypothetical protein